MRFPVRSLIAVAAASVLGACASGGGGSGSETQTAIDGVFCAVLGQDADCAARARASQGAPATQGEYVRPTLTKWSDYEADTVQTTGTQVAINYEYEYEFGTQGSLRPASDPALTYGARVDLYQSSAQVQLLESGDVDLHYGKPVEGHAGIEMLHNFGSTYHTLTEFSDSPASNVGLVANPYNLDWNFQSFGVWNDSSAATITASSYGPASPATAVPASGSAAFTGKLAGLYISPTGQGSMAAADLNVSVDFGRRLLDLASSGTTITRDREVATAAPHLNVSGSLSYAPGSASFSGTLVNASGTMTGASNGTFYGPAAQELGGTFTVQSPTTVETFVGAYGAKR